MARFIIAACAASAIAACAQPEPADRDGEPIDGQDGAAEAASPDNGSQAESAPEGGSSGPRTGATPDEPDETSGGSGDIPPPQAALPDDARTIDADYLIGPWTARGGDCGRPAFDISEVPGADQPSIETSLDGAPRTGVVRTGAGAAFVFDQPETVFLLEKRRAQGLAVLPPEDGPSELGGETIEGDGVVFIKCAEA